MENKKDDILVFEFKKDLYSCEIYSQPNKNIETDTKLHSIILDVYNETFKNNLISKDLNLRVLINHLNIYLYVEYLNDSMFLYNESKGLKQDKGIQSLMKIISKSEFKYSRLEPKVIILHDLENLFKEMNNYKSNLRIVKY